MHKAAPRIYLNHISQSDSIGNSSISVSGSRLENTIDLPANNRNLTISYGLSDYLKPEERRYAYRLKGYDENWNYIGSVYDLVLTNLPAGNYQIEIKGANYRGQWSSNTIIIPIHAREFFYKTWWFYVLCALPFIGFAMLWAYRQRQEQKRLEVEVDKRTDTIRQQTEELKQLDKVKSKLYTNITHEFRTPLTVIRGLADRAHEDTQAPEMIRRNADSLLNLVNQMLDLRKLESGNLKVEPVQADLINSTFSHQTRICTWILTLTS